MTLAAVEPVRRALLRAILAECAGGEVTVLTHLVAVGFVTHVAEADEGRGVLRLLTWAERTCARYGALPSIASLLRVACGVAAHELSRLGAGTSIANDLTVLDALIAERLDALTAAEPPNAPAMNRLDEIIASFLMRLDDADPLTAEHSRAVSLWCRRLARRMSLSVERTAFVARGGLLHDVGKTSTPKEILLAPRALTADEYAIIQNHATFGAQLVAQADELKPFVPMVGSHHERLDGKGYPNRLSANEIALEVRIVTVADCFNAMIGRRPYRQPLSPSVALDQLVRHRGTQFDPLVVDAMIDVIEHPD